MKATILSGVPGSGKSTYGESLITYQLASPPVIGEIYSADHYFTNPYTGEYNFDPAKLGAAHSSCLLGFIGATSAHSPRVIVDNTNTTAVEIAPYYQVALAYGYDVEIVTVMVNHGDLAKCAERNKHGVPLKSIIRMADNIKRRVLPPYWNHRTIEATF